MERGDIELRTIEDEIQEAPTPPPPPPDQDDHNVFEEIDLPVRRASLGKSNQIAVEITPPTNLPFVPCKIERECRMWIAGVSDAAWPLFLLNSTYVNWLSPLCISIKGDYWDDAPATLVALLITFLLQFLMGVMLIIRLAIGTRSWLPMTNYFRWYRTGCFSVIIIMLCNTLSAFVILLLGTKSHKGWLIFLLILHAAVYMSLRWMNACIIKGGINFVKAHKNGQHKNCKHESPS